jgi:hypothetical protein
MSKKVDLDIGLYVTPLALVYLRRISLSSIGSLNRSTSSFSLGGISYFYRSANVSYLNSALSAIAIVRRNVESS